jgi:hypothetical protein
MRSAAALAFLGLALTACADAPPVAKSPAASDDPDVRAVNAVLLSFQHALVAHDGAALAAMMASPDVVFRSRQVDGGKIYTSTAGEFAKEVTEAKETWEEQFAHVSITARDGLAVLDSDYKFLANGKVTNHGREVWTLIRAADGWKISMITWSIIADPTH